MTSPPGATGGAPPDGSAEARAALLGRAATGAPPVTVRRLAGGHANTVMAVGTAGGHRVVVRLYERRPGVAAVERAVLDRARGAVPVPEVLLADPEGEVAGQPALVQAHVDGVLAGALLAGAGAATAARVAALLGGTLVALQGLTFPRPGFFRGPDLEPDGMPGTLRDRLDGYLDETLPLAREQGADGRLLDAWRRLALAAAARSGEVGGPAVLVHADYNPKNVLLASEGDGWRVAAVLDWEFAFAGSWLHDLGNLLRLAEDHPPGYAAAAARGVREAGGVLPPGWRETAAVLDVFALADFLARGPAAAGYGDALRLVARAVARGRLAAEVNP